MKGNNWHFNGAENYYVKRGLDRHMVGLLGNCDDLNLGEHPLVDSAKTLVAKDMRHPEPSKLEHKIYKTKQEFKELFEGSTKPLSVVQLEDGSFGAMIKGTVEGGSCALLPLKCIRNDESTGSPIERTSSCGASYIHWEVSTDEAGARDHVTLTECKHHCLLLPHHSNTEFQNDYYLVTSDWMEMRCNGTIGPPFAIGLLYDDGPRPPSTQP